VITISVEADIKKAIAGLTRLERDQVPFATSLALNRTANVAKAEVVRAMQQVFDRPTKFTLNSLYVKPSNKRNLQVKVGIKDYALKAKPPIEWLAPQVYGGPRRMKRFEERLRQAGVLGVGQYAVPASGAAKDAYGNMSKGQIVAILSDLRAHFDPTQNSTRASRAKRANRKGKRGGIYFAVTARRGKLRPGVYERIGFGFGAAIRPVLIFVSGAPTYRKRLQFDRVVKETVEMRFNLEFTKAMRQALRTAYRDPLPVAA
jgi:hypothetical protein